MQEDLYVFLLIGPVKAPNVPARNIIHGDLGVPDLPLKTSPRPEEGWVT